MKHVLPMMMWSFRKLVDGYKKVDLRLFDDERQKIRPNDLIEFECPELGQKALCRVKGFLVFDIFETMIALLPPQPLGYENRDEIRLRIERIYPLEEQRKHGVMGIFVELLDEKSNYYDHDANEIPNTEKVAKEILELSGRQENYRVDIDRRVRVKKAENTKAALTEDEIQRLIGRDLYETGGRG